MKKEKSIFICSECGYQSIKSLGRCPNCGQWNTFIEEYYTSTEKFEGKEIIYPKKLSEIEVEEKGRIKTGIEEFDRVLGGGIVKKSYILISGEPGVGKSTLLLSVCGNLAKNGYKILYISGEESENQIKMRSKRLGIESEQIYLLASSEINTIKNGLEKIKPDFIIVDSIQTVYNPEIPTIPGSVTQVRENANFFMRYTKNNDCSTFLVGHITKEGVVAGPKILEHIVDAVIYFEGDVRTNLRILRNIKNRFGSTNEIGVFSMEENGLKEIPDASKLFIQDIEKNLPGRTIFPTIEGTRTILVEIEGLVTPTYYGVPRRTVSGVDYNRVSLIIAVLEKKLKLNFNTYDVYINVGGGLRINEVSSDLAIAISCVSSLKDISPIKNTVLIGEIGLTGEIRRVENINLRLRECERLGIEKAIIPERNKNDISVKNIKIYPVGFLYDALNIALNL
ncbi:MAG: DNA repair protein RadA [Candidatus Omnitrophica bacterium]|nr:DNA repair protein RadA [Candidatus Omnitrophota bacterium]MCM8809856.1 DNA repair protein RadA [Candidatus Omnitrophota bacterium]